MYASGKVPLPGRIVRHTILALCMNVTDAPSATIPHTEKSYPHQ